MGYLINAVKRSYFLLNYGVSVNAMKSSYIFTLQSFHLIDGRNDLM
jgi:hypothetical protein